VSDWTVATSTACRHEGGQYLKKETMGLLGGTSKYEGESVNRPQMEVKQL
jgi:hypothetical protein